MSRIYATLISDTKESIEGSIQQVSGSEYSVDAVLSAAAPCDGFSVPADDKDRTFIRAKVVSTTGGVKPVFACVEE